MSRFFCLSIPDFPAWAVARSDADLRDKPLVIYASGKVLAASPLAREVGVQTGWSVSRAQAMVPGLVTLPHHAATTQSAWQEVLMALYDLTPRIESLRPGLALAHLSTETIVTPLLREWQAHGGSAQGAVADDRTSAELAALTASPGCLRRIHPGRSGTFLHCVPLPLLQHVGVSSRTVERLGWFGWQSVAHLRALTKRQLVAQFPEGATLFRYAQGNDVRPVSTYRLPDILRAHYSFEQSVREPREVEPVLMHLIAQLLPQLENRSAGSLAVGLETPQGWMYGRRLLRDESTTERAITTHALLALQAVLPRAKDVSAMELQMGTLTATQPIQGQLFEPSRPAVEKALSGVEHRYPGLMQRIVMVERNAYLPEEAHRFEPMALASAIESASERDNGSARSSPKRARVKSLAGAR